MLSVNVFDSLLNSMQSHLTATVVIAAADAAAAANAAADAAAAADVEC